MLKFNLQDQKLDWPIQCYHLKFYYNYNFKLKPNFKYTFRNKIPSKVRDVFGCDCCCCGWIDLKKSKNGDLLFVSSF